VACCAHVACTRKRSAPRTVPSAGVADVSIPPAVGGALERPPRLKVCRAFEITFAARPGVPAAAAAAAAAAWASHRVFGPS
jgi:hypothetical protein